MMFETSPVYRGRKQNIFLPHMFLNSMRLKLAPYIGDGNLKEPSKSITISTPV